MAGITRAVRSAEFGVRNETPNTPNSEFRIPNYRGGYSSLEYAVLIAVAAAALVGMALYTMRAASGRFRQVGDVFGYGRQYDPKVTNVPSAEVIVTQTAEVRP